MYTLEEYDRTGCEIVADLPTFNLFYEDHLANPDALRLTMGQIFSLLGVSDVRSESDEVRRRPRKAREVFANYDELARVVSLNRYGSFLEEDASPDSDMTLRSA